MSEFSVGESCHCHAQFAAHGDYLDEVKQQLVEWRRHHDERCPANAEKVVAAKQEFNKVFGPIGEFTKTLPEESR